MSNRYRLPDPVCRHVAVGRIEAGDPRGGPHASTYVCARWECIADAKEWAAAITHQEPSELIPMLFRKAN